LFTGIFHLQKNWAPFKDDRLVVLISNDAMEWKYFLTCPEPENEQIPYFDARSHQDFMHFHRLVLLRFCRPDRFAAAVQKFVGRHLEVPLRQPFGMNMHDAYSKSDSQTPILILTCSNVNPATVVQDVAKTKVIRCQAIPLGNTGSRELAQKMMISGPGLGMWYQLSSVPSS
jgi:hypothetical protein